MKRTYGHCLLGFALVLCIGCRPPVQPRCLPCSSYLPADLDVPGSSDICPTAGAWAAPGEIRDYETLVFQGGGVKGIAYGGALPAFGDERLAGVKSVAGTSAGAITALAVGVGYDTEQVCKLSQGIDFERFEDGRLPGNVVRLFKQYGWFKGDYALCLLECVVERQTGSRDTTFRQLNDLRQEDPAKYKDLFVFGTNVNTRQSVEFSNRREATRDVPIARAARISMSIPFFFASVERDGDRFVDGGVLRNYPLHVEDSGSPNFTTLGFHLGAEPKREDSANLFQFTEDVLITILNDQIDATCRTPADIERSIFIDTCGIATTDFAITPAEKRMLVRSGRMATESFLQGDVPETCPDFVDASSSSKRCQEDIERFLEARGETVDGQ